MLVENYDRIKGVIRAKTGIDLGSDKDYLIPSRLGAMLEQFQLGSYDDLAAALTMDPSPVMQAEFIDRIATHETLFFRDESMYTALLTQIIPEWLTRNYATNRRLKIWCAGCSTGQEPYSIMMLLKEKLPHIFDRTDLYATDISPICVDYAAAGVFTSREVSRGLSDEYLQKYFTPKGDAYQIAELLKRPIKFSPGNLLEMTYPEQCDIVLCRNVLIYFDQAVRTKILERMRSLMARDSVLILGSAESLSGYLDNYIVRECGLARYYELNASRVTIVMRK